MAKNTCNKPYYRAPGAPWKKPTKVAKFRKTVFEDSNVWKELHQNANEVLPNVCLLLHAKIKRYEFTTLLALISDKQFPLDIIKLLLKVTRWYGLKSTQMFYGDETVLFWIVIYQLYHAAGIIRFWSVTKQLCNTSQECVREETSIPSWVISILLYQA